jgi:hypothetical protein
MWREKREVLKMWRLVTRMWWEEKYWWENLGGNFAVTTFPVYLNSISVNGMSTT